MQKSSSPKPARRVLIVGGGAAGWLTACYLARHLGGDRADGLDITLLESPDIGIIGVGEGTFPTIRNILRTLGIDEGTFMRESHATFKQGIRFDDWEVAPQVNASGDLEHSHYLHPFEAPYWGREELQLVPYWLLQDKATRKPFAEAVTFQKRVADSSLGPKRLHQGNYQGPLNYAYHFDANLFAALLAKHAKTLGVRHLSGLMSGVILAADGSIDHVTSPDHGDLDADLFIDCTGFRSELLGKALNVPFKRIDDILFTDRAITVQVPYATPDAPLPSYTISTAHEAGWTWDIGLPERRGVGYVYSSQHSTDERAAEVLRAYTGLSEDAMTRSLRFEAGYRTAHWVKNCVGVGLSAGFLEPLESTGMVLIESAVNKIVEYFPFTGPLDASADLFNDQMITRYNTIIGFIKLHYCLSKRQEPFWRDNTQPDSIPEHLQKRLALWKTRPPSRFDFILDYESFAHFSYQYILYGMGFETDFEAARGAYTDTELAKQIFGRVVDFGGRASADLVSHRSLIKAIYKGGFTEQPPVGAKMVAR